MDLLVNGDTDDIIKFCDEVAAEMEEALLQTPELLPVLKQAELLILAEAFDDIYSRCARCLEAVRQRISQ